MTSTPLRLVGDALACVRGARELFSGLSFEAAAGRVLLVTGPNGAGKSSLLRLVAGLVAPVAGKLSLAGGDRELSLAEQAHFLGHQDAIKPALGVAENLAFWIAALGGSPGLPVAKALDAVGIARLKDLPAQYLSAGQRRRLALARLLAVRRPVWLLDEPTTALDVAGQGRLAELLTGHLSAGGIALAATHQSIGVRGDELRLGGGAAAP